MYERFTDRARKVMQLANDEAIFLNHEHIGTEHIMLGLAKEDFGVATIVLKNLGIDSQQIRDEVMGIVQSGPDIVTTSKLPQSPRAKNVIKYSMEECRLLGHNYVGTEHMLLGLIREDGGVASQVLMNLGLTLDALRIEVVRLIGGNDPTEAQSPIEPLSLSMIEPILRAAMRRMWVRVMDGKVETRADLPELISVDQTKEPE